MKKFFVITLLAALLAGCKSQPSATELVENMKNSSGQFNSIHLKWNYKLKRLLHQDTMRSQVEAWVTLSDIDTNFGANILVNYMPDSSWGILLDNQGYIYNAKRNTITHYPVRYAKYAVMGEGSELFDYLLNPDKLDKIFTDTLNKISIGDTVINSREMWAVKVNSPDDEDLTQRLKIFFFDKKTNLLYGLYKEVYVISDWYKEMALVDTIEFNTVENNYIKNFFDGIKQEAEMKELPVGDDDNNFELLQVAQKAPDITGKYYDTGQDFKLYDQTAKVYVIDFWYQSCRPCMKAIPYLVELNNKYKDQGLMVIGVNSVDNTEQRRPYIEKFIENKQVNYPVIMVERTIDQMYKVPGYPTVYVLDKDKKVMGYEVGFDESTKLDKIEELVKKALEEEK